VEELENDLMDDYQCQYQKGDRILKGHLFIGENIPDMTFTAVAYAATVCHICSELSVKKRG